MKVNINLWQIAFVTELKWRLIYFFLDSHSISVMPKMKGNWLSTIPTVNEINMPFTTIFNVSNSSPDALVVYPC